jgi:hypothetical protein
VHRRAVVGAALDVAVVLESDGGRNDLVVVSVAGVPDGDGEGDLFRGLGVFLRETDLGGDQVR